MIKVVVAQAVRDLAQLANNVQDWPQTAKGASIKALNGRKDYLIAKLTFRGIKALRRIPGFHKGGSQVEEDLIVKPGGFGQRGVSSVSIQMRTKKSFMIAEAWDKGAVIVPKNVKYLAEPLSEGKRLPLSPKKFLGSNYTSFFYKNPSIINPSLHPFIVQDISGLMVIRDKKNLVKSSRFNNKTGKVEKRNVGKPVQSFVLMKRQVIKATNWAGRAVAEFREQDVPVIAKDIVENLKAIKVAP